MTWLIQTLGQLVIIVAATAAGIGLVYGGLWLWFKAWLRWRHVPRNVELLAKWQAAYNRERSRPAPTGYFLTCPDCGHDNFSIHPYQADDPYPCGDCGAYFEYDAEDIQHTDAQTAPQENSTKPLDTPAAEVTDE